MFKRIAIVNRGEAAMRLIHAVRDLNAERPADERIETVALHTEGERKAMFVREADLSYNLGPAGERPYINHAVLERALLESGADAAWVGWGFVAEDPAFAELCERVGVTFIGPSPEAMRKLGLPRHIDRLTLLGAPPSGARLTAVVTPRPDGAFDARIVDDDGHVFVTLDGYRTTPLGDVDPALRAPLSAAVV